jgi:hypothetical protein
MFISRLVLKLGLVRFATSFLVVLLASVLNRVLIVDLTVPAALVTFSFAFQHVMTPVGLVTGYFSDNYTVRGRHRAPYIWGGMLLSIVIMPFFPNWALALGAQPHSHLLLYHGVLLFSLFGIGTTVSATAINALLVDRIPEADRGSALTMVWILTLLGFIVGSALTGVLFPVFDPAAIHKLFGVVTLVVLAITLWGAWDIEPRREAEPSPVHGQLGLGPTLKFLASNRRSPGPAGGANQPVRDLHHLRHPGGHGGGACAAEPAARGQQDRPGGQPGAGGRGLRLIKHDLFSA